MQTKNPRYHRYSEPLPAISDHLRDVGDAGGAVLEYVLVSAFAAAVGMAALGFVGKVVKQHLESMSQRFGTTEDPEVTLPWDQPS
jgi:hypothetical protein